MIGDWEGGRVACVMVMLETTVTSANAAPERNTLQARRPRTTRRRGARPGRVAGIRARQKFGSWILPAEDGYWTVTTTVWQEKMNNF